MDGGDLGSLADLLGHSSVLVTKEFYGVFTMQELQEKHAQHSPVAQLLTMLKRTSRVNRVAKQRRLDALVRHAF